MYVRVLDSFCEKYVSRESGAKRGFDPEKAYRVHKIESYSDTGAGYVVLVNDEREIWWVDNRHVRVVTEDDFLFDTSNAETAASQRTSWPYMS